MKSVIVCVLLINSIALADLSVQIPNKNSYLQGVDSMSCKNIYQYLKTGDVVQDIHAKHFTISKPVLTYQKENSKFTLQLISIKAAASNFSFTCQLNSAEIQFLPMDYNHFDSYKIWNGELQNNESLTFKCPIKCGGVQTPSGNITIDAQVTFTGFETNIISGTESPYSVTQDFKIISLN